jgi:acetolactate synthase-1/2/3 large subunit
MAKSHPLYFGMLGNNGKPYANRAVSKCDLLIVVGARIADRAVPKPENLERQLSVIHIDIDSAEIGKNLGPTLPLVGDVKNIFTALAEADIHIDTTEWIQTLEEIKHSTVDHRTWSDKLVNPMILVQTLSEKMEDDAIYVADVGQNQLWSADNYVMKNGRYMTTGGMGTMGYSIPAAVGAKMCEPDKQVVAVCGDGSFQMSMYELATITINKVGLKILVMRNEYLGLVREHQQKVYEGHYSGVQLYDYPHYDKIAAAYDMDYFECSSNEELDGTLDAFLSCKNACIMVCNIDSSNVVI